MLILVLVPASASAGVMVKNKDKKEVTILVKRAGSTTETGVPGGVTMELPGAPVKVTVKKTGAAVEGLEGDTLVIEKGKITRVPGEGSVELPPEEDEVEPEATPEATP